MRNVLRTMHAIRKYELKVTIVDSTKINNVMPPVEKLFHSVL